MSRRGYAADTAQIILDHVEKTYSGGVKAINDLSLDVKDGEFMVFVGPSGCGKSTALRSIAGLEEITAGKIQVGDRVVNDLSSKDRDIAMVFQNHALYPHTTVEQNLAFGRRAPAPGSARSGARGRQLLRPAAEASAAAPGGPCETIRMQRNPEELFELSPAAPDISDAPMLHYLDGFIDAGNAGRLLAEHLLRNFSHEKVAQFDVDRLIDYRSRRPLMTYDNSHWESYDPPELALHLLRDAAERPFLLLTGPEPDHEWNLFTEAVLAISARLEIGPAISFLGIPAGMPHTRPLGVIAHATREELMTGHQRLPSRIQVPGSAPALIELRFGEAGRDALGFAVQVPHYLAQAVYPPAALALLGSVTATTGLDLPDAELREAAERTNEAIERQVAESAEVGELVRALEQQYDTATQEAENPVAGLLAEGEAMPTADELAAQFERFLAENQGRTDPPGSQGSPDH